MPASVMKTRLIIDDALEERQPRRADIPAGALELQQEEADHDQQREAPEVERELARFHPERAREQREDRQAHVGTPGSVRSMNARLSWPVSSWREASSAPLAMIAARTAFSPSFSASKVTR